MTNNKIHTIFIEETPSTNALAKELLKEGEQELPFIVQSNFQTKGKGQFSKVWESNAGENLLFSLVIKAPSIPIEKQFNISKAVATAVLQVLKSFAQLVCIKWPNDIYVGNNKIAGILIENTIIGQQIDSCIIGIGLNVNQTIFPSNVPNPTSLKLLTSTEHNINTIKNSIAEQIIDQLNNLDLADSLFDKHLYRKGELGRFTDDKEKEFLGVILGVDEIGKLLIRKENNQVISFTNNEISFILPEIN